MPNIVKQVFRFVHGEPLRLRIAQLGDCGQRAYVIVAVLLDQRSGVSSVSPWRRRPRLTCCKGVQWMSVGAALKWMISLP